MEVDRDGGFQLKMRIDESTLPGNYLVFFVLDPCQEPTPGTGGSQPEGGGAAPSQPTEGDTGCLIRNDVTKGCFSVTEPGDAEAGDE
jgi:hypothetical protein